MSAAFQNIADVALFAETLSIAQSLWVVLWVGLVALSVAMIVLMWTRWGQAKPLSKCIALSVFAHVLLVGYAYSTKLFFDAPNRGGEDIVRLSLDPASRDDQDQQAQRPPQPWEQMQNQPSIVPAAVKPERRDTSDQSPSPRKQLAELPDFPSPAENNTVKPDQPSRPSPSLPKASALPGDTAATIPTKIEAPSVARRVETESPLPNIARPRQVPTPETDNTALKPPLAVDLPKNLLDPTSPLQQLTDANLKTETADAVNRDRENLRQSTNRDDNIARRNQAPSPSNPPANQVATGNPPTPAINDAASKVPRRLGDGQKLPEVYNHRLHQNRLRLAKQYGGSAETEAAVDAALRWLAGCQHRDGRWDASAYGAGQATRALEQVPQRPGAEADTGITGLVLLAFLARGHSHLEGQYREKVQHGLEFLLRSQHDNGSLAGQAKTYASMYCHGMATLALSEAYAITGDQRMKSYVERAVQYTVKAQHSTSGGWRYQPGDRGDMSQFGWQVMALQSAQLAGIDIPAQTKTGMAKFLTSVSSGRHGGLASYRVGEQANRTMTAEALACRFFLNADRNQATLKEAAEYITAELPRTGDKANLYYWYYATLALFQMQDERWQRWNESLARELLSRQNDQGNLAGSWDPDTEWGDYGGRVYSTAMATLSLEVYYRYLPIYGK